MEEKDFLLLRTLKETQSVTRAAERLYMTQSALSKRIGTLERELGVELLLRSRQGVRFTAEGELVLSGCSGAADVGAGLEGADVIFITSAMYGTFRSFVNGSR